VSPNRKPSEKEDQREVGFMAQVGKLSLGEKGSGVGKCEPLDLLLQGLVVHFKDKTFKLHPP